MIIAFAFGMFEPQRGDIALENYIIPSGFGIDDFFSIILPSLRDFRVPIT